ncbi:MAG TPA: RNA methyltransferase [Spongiibacteraceae bacterium]|jgi:23S rRNA (guanosine2251-2'-O)-methyltransferase|nr:RNA methyltransferase [Spongiibacteraceae bacterium]HUH38284.1 RNA methyltransferase [Spongiibacteraceae bacterium]
MPDYQQRKAFFDGMLTIYGRKPVLEALQDDSLPIYRLHLADSNRRGAVIDELLGHAARRNIETLYHSREALARISRNGKQDQGVACDIQLPAYRPLKSHLKNLDPAQGLRLLAVDRVTNPQNLGMIVRSVAAGFLDGLVLARKGNAAISPLVIKASAGALFRCPILHCDQLSDALRDLRQAGCTIVGLSSHAEQSLFDYRPPARLIYVVGNETDGVSAEVNALATQRLRIPMNNGVESLNVAITASLLAFYCRTSDV